MTIINNKIITGLFVLATMSGLAQPYEQWVGIYNGSGTDLGRAMVIDNSGNSYVAGTSDGIGTGRDCAVVKYDSLGNEVWVARYNGTDSLDDWGYAVVVDNTGNVYLTGQSNSLANDADYITIKFDAQGNQQWVKSYNGTASGSDVAVDIALDQAGNVFITGKSEGTNSMEDYVTIKYDNNGNELWVKRYNGPGNKTDDARSIFADRYGNIYISGGSMGDTTDYDFATIKYDNQGNEKWVTRYNGTGNAYDLVFYQGSVVVDSLLNVYITGYSTAADSLYEYVVLKYDSLGNMIWNVHYAGDRMGKDDFADAITLDDSLNVYISGAMYDSISDYDFMTIKYDKNGNLKWTASYDGTDSGWDEAYSVLVDDSGNVYVGGRSNKANFTGADYVIVKYDSAGNELWNVRYSRGGFSWPFKLRMDNDANLFIGGWSSMASPNGADFTVVKYGWTPVGVQVQGSYNSSTSFSYPNPFSNETTIKYQLVHESKVSLTIHNLLGERVRTLIEQKQKKGNHCIVWNGKDDYGNNVARGAYLYIIKTGEKIYTRKIILE